MSSFVPESLRLKQKRNELQKSISQEEFANKQKYEQKLLELQIQKTQQHYIEYERIQNEKIEQRRLAKQNGYYREDEDRLLFVIRIRGVNGIPPKPKKILELFRLLQINNGIFLKVNKASKQMLQIITPYVTFGDPSLKSIHDLVYKRGYCKIRKQRIPLSSNDLVRDNLGQYNIICIEDLIHELYTVGPHFKEANQFLWPFKLAAPTGGYNSILKGFNEGGDLGDRAEYITIALSRFLLCSKSRVFRQVPRICKNIFVSKYIYKFRYTKKWCQNEVINS